MLNVGDKAPDFNLMSDEGEEVHLRDFAGKNVILYFYPKDDTPGCTKEACSFRDENDAFARRRAVILGVSLDDVQSHQSFKEKYGLPFTLLSDPDAAVSKAYDAYKQKNMYGRKFWGIERTTFIIGPDGRVKAVFPKVRVDGHHEEVLAALT